MYNQHDKNLLLLIEKWVFLVSKKLKDYFSVAFFAFLGGAVRCYFNLLWSMYGTFIANIIGSFVLALITYFLIEYKHVSQWLKTGLTTGLVGAFTTFSTFQLDTLKLLQSNYWFNGCLYFMLSIILGFTFAYLGMQVGKSWGKKVGKKIC